MLDDLAPSMQQQAVRAAVRDGWRLDKADAYCWRCGATAGPGSVTPRGCRTCQAKQPAWDRIVRLGSYQQPLDQWIVAMKFARQWRWSNWFGRLLARRIGPSDQPTVVCPIPMHWRRRWQRGYNQAELIAQSIARTAHWPMLPLLIRCRYTLPQTQVQPSRRTANIGRSFKMPAVDLSGYRVVLVDDVTTSGATLHACASLLKKANASLIVAAVVAVASHDTPAA